MPTKLLNDDGTASMATMIMTSHHAFRRDLACFARAITEARPTTDVQTEWKTFRDGLHHHHTIEDTSMFPDIRGKHPEAAAAIDQLGAQHHQIDPLLERGDALFANLSFARDEAHQLIGKLVQLLDEHLELEERTVIPHLRDAKFFPIPPGDDAAMTMYAGGFAWSTAGIAPPVVDQVLAMLPAGLVEKFPAARAEFEARCRRVWGYTHEGATVTSVPAARS